jgi:hypothetical protein
MPHLNPEQWLDFARNLTPPADRAALQRHLDEGCESCRAAVEAFRRVAVAGAAQANLEVPGTAVELALSIFPARPEPESSWQSLRRLAARLVYNSLTDPLPAGVREVRTAGQQVMYQSGDYFIDLRLDAEHDSAGVLLIGQILRRGSPESRLGSLPVLLFSGKKEIVRTASDEFGEFCLQYTPKSGMRLCVPLSASGGRIEISLNPFRAVKNV